MATDTTSSTQCYNYIVSAHKPTSVTDAVRGNFTAPNHVNLLVAKNTLVEIYQITPEGLKAVRELNIFGRIMVMKLFRPAGFETDLLFLVTRNCDVMILQCRMSMDASENLEESDNSFSHGNFEIATLASGNVIDKIGRLADTGFIGIIDTKGEVLGLRLYEGLFKIIPLSGFLQEDRALHLRAFNVRLDDVTILDMEFLENPNDSTSPPLLAYLFHDSRGRHVHTKRLDLIEHDLLEGPWQLENVEHEATLLKRVPGGGLLVLGQEVVTWRSPDGRITSAEPKMLRHAGVTCCAVVDDRRFLLGDEEGRLFMLFLDGNVKVELLGEVSIPEALCYLDNGVVYVGSRMGDSQLVRLRAQRSSLTDLASNVESCSSSNSTLLETAAGNEYLEVLEEFTNLGPILDMVVADVEQQGQCQLITCSGNGKDGSLRIVRNGIGIREDAIVDLEGVKGLWALRTGINATSSGNVGYHDVLVLSFVGATRTLQLEGGEMEEVPLEAFEQTQQTYHCANVAHQQLLQITASSARLIDAATRRFITLWRFADDQPISVASSNTCQVLLASGARLAYLRIEAGELVLVNQVMLDNEVACLDVTPLNSAAFEATSELVAVGLWKEISANLLTLPELTLVNKESLLGDIIPRSILMTAFEGMPFLFVGMGDGALIYYQIATNGTLTDRKRVILGTQPMTLRQFNSQSQTSVFACSDRPAVVYWSNHKLIIANVNLKEVTQVCSLHADAYHDSLALSSSKSLLFGKIDQIQKLHIRTVKLGEAPRRLTHQEETRTFGVLSSRLDVRQDGRYAPTRGDCVSERAVNRLRAEEWSKQSQLPANPEQDEQEVFSLLIFQQDSWECTHAYQLAPTEFGLSICSCRLADDPAVYYCVGSAFILKDECEPSKGRIQIFRLEEGGRLERICTKDVRGAVYSLLGFQGRLLCSINSTVRLFEWNRDSRELRGDCVYFNTIVALFLKTKGDYILLGDMMRSMSLLKHKTHETQMEELARDFTPNWLTAVEFVDDDLMLGAESNANIFACSKEVDTGPNAATDKQFLVETGQYHVGEFINVFRHGSLVMEHAKLERAIPTRGSILYGTVNGAIGMITQCANARFFDLLQRLEQTLVKVVPGIGNIEHVNYRSFCTERQTQLAKGFIDGDLVESFLDLNQQQMRRVAEAMSHIPSDLTSAAVSEDKPCTVDDLMKIVEELTRLH